MNSVTVALLPGCVARDVGGDHIDYLLDSDRQYAQVLAERDANGDVLARYAHAVGPVAMTRGADRAYYHTDGTLTVRQLTDDAGAVTDTFDYLAYGELDDRTGATNNPHRYRGEYLDDAVGLYDLRARWYSPERGRFDQIDPFRGFDDDPLTRHRYLYGLGDPVNRMDPSGQFSMGFGIAMAGFAALAVSSVSMSIFYGVTEERPGGERPGALTGDAQKLVAEFDRLIEQYNQTGIRSPYPVVNNTFGAQGIFKLAEYLDCYNQNEKLNVDLATFAAQNLGSGWTFSMEGNQLSEHRAEAGTTAKYAFGIQVWPFPHWWGVARSNDPSQPVIRFDARSNSIVASGYCRTCN